MKVKKYLWGEKHETEMNMVIKFIGKENRSDPSPSVSTK